MQRLRAVLAEHSDHGTKTMERQTEILPVWVVLAVRDESSVASESFFKLAPFPVPYFKCAVFTRRSDGRVDWMEGNSSDAHPVSGKNVFNGIGVR